MSGPDDSSAIDLSRIEVTPFPLTVGAIAREHRTGSLLVVRDQMRTTLYWSEGSLVMVTGHSAKMSLGAFLLRSGIVTEDVARQLTPRDWTDSVPLFLEQCEATRDIPRKEIHLRRWMMEICQPLFSLTSGTTVFTEGDRLEERRRVYIRSTPAFIVEGIRSIENGLVLRRSLGDLSTTIVRSSRPAIETVRLSFRPVEQEIMEALEGPESIEDFARRLRHDSATVARTIIIFLILGVFEPYDPRKAAAREGPMTADDSQQDLMLMMAIGASDERTLRAIAFSRSLPSLTHYQVLAVPSAASRVEIMKQFELVRAQYDPATFPPAARTHVEAIRRRIDGAFSTLENPELRDEYDKLLRKATSGEQSYSIEQSLTRRRIAEQNYRRAMQLRSSGDFYGAIVLLKQAVGYAPDHAEAWYLLGSCQGKNPQWLDDAVASMERAVAINPNHIDALIELGDLYRLQGAISRAETCYEDVLQIHDNHPLALGRLKRKARHHDRKRDDAE